jgi:hypothetical protein
MILLTALALAGSLWAQPRPSSESSEWFKCERDAECVNIRYPCSGGDVNKKFQKEANEYYSHQNAIRDCAIKEGGKALPFKVFCKQNKCTHEGVNPKMGFS